jgi:oligopeptidase B
VSNPNRSTTTEVSPAAPTAPQRRHTWKRPTGDVDDPFAWMRDTNDPALHEYLRAENGFSTAWFEGHDSTVEEIFQEIRSRVQETDMSAPVAFGEWWYVTRTAEAMSYPTHHRGGTRESASSETLLDENVEADGHEYFDLGAFDLSHDHTIVAWSFDIDGDERYTLRIRDLSTGLDLDDEIPGTSNAGVAWSAGGAWILYVRPDEQERPSEVWRHRLGEPVERDVLVYQESDERYFVGIGTTRSGVWNVIHAGSRTSSEVRVLRADDPTGEPTTVLGRRDGVEYLIDHWGDRFVMQTNDDAIDFRVLAAPVDGDWTDPEAWTELVAHEPGRRITGIEPFEHHAVVHEWAAAQPRLRILSREGSIRVIDLGTEPHDVDLAPNPAWDTDVVRFGTQSMTTPPTLFDENVTSGERALLRRIPTPNVDLDRYTSARIWATAGDGTSVPIDLVHHRDTPLDGTAPGVLYGYGAYEASLPPWFSVARLSLLDRGFVWALAHPRGGGELGRQWYLDGKLLAKPNSFSDMITCAEHLGSSGFIAPDRLSIRGGSAGGLLVGACVTQRPELFAAVVAEVPFVDVVSTMSDPSLPLTVTEWEEWGDPRTEPLASCIESYSPYDNTAPAAYPAMYLTAGLTDPRVSVHEPAKWAARLRMTQTGDAPILLRTEMDAGHGGPTGRYDAWRDEARTLAFLLATV